MGSSAMAGERRPYTPRIPRYALLLAGLAVAAALVWAFLGQPSDEEWAPFPTSPVVAERMLSVADIPAGGVEIRDAATGRLLGSFAAGEGSFFRGILRSFTFERRKQRLGSADPYRLAAHRNGQLTLTDTATGIHLTLSAFGPDNKAVFAAFLAPDGTNGTNDKGDGT